MFLGRKNQYCENAYTTKYNLQIQCNPYQITNDILFVDFISLIPLKQLKASICLFNSPCIYAVQSPFCITLDQW